MQHLQADNVLEPNNRQLEEGLEVQARLAPRRAEADNPGILGRGSQLGQLRRRELSDLQAVRLSQKSVVIV